jgi:DNA-binding XRE family transcriptional regulator
MKIDDKDKRSKESRPANPGAGKDQPPAEAGAASSDPEPTSSGADAGKSAGPTDPKSGGGKARKGKEPSGRRKVHNNLREFRIERMMSKAELARKAGLSVLTIDRIEKGYGCRMDTKRKILKALGLKLADRRKVFQEE